MKTLNVKWLDLSIELEMVCSNCGTPHTETVKVKQTDSQVTQESEVDLDATHIKGRISEILHDADAGCGWRDTRIALNKLIGREDE